MVSLSNPLGIPKEHFGTTGIRTGYFIYESIRKQGNGLEVKYELSTRQITVLNSSKVLPCVLEKILRTNIYSDWIPQLNEKRDAQDNLQIQLVPIMTSDEENSPTYEDYPKYYSDTYENKKISHRTYNKEQIKQDLTEIVKLLGKPTAKRDSKTFLEKPAPS